METVPIASLEGLRDSESKQLHGVVTLIWPYSSSTQQAALLIAETDFRLRYKKGQVRVQVHGPAAVAVAHSKLGIGDEITLKLDGARWVETSDGVSTPGRSVDLELEYGARLDLQVRRSGIRDKHVHVDEPFDSSLRTSRHQLASLLETPRAITPIPRRLVQDISKATPNFHQRARLSSGSDVDSPLDPFGDSDIDNDRQRKKPRVSWGTPNRWKVIRQTPSPQKSSRTKEEDVFWLGSQQSQLSEADTPPPSDQNSAATSPISEAELTQIVEDARQDFFRSRREQELADEDNGSSNFRPYRDPPAVEIAVDESRLLDNPNRIPTRSTCFASQAIAPQLESEIDALSKGTADGMPPEVIDISSDSDSAESEEESVPPNITTALSVEDLIDTTFMPDTQLTALSPVSDEAHGSSLLDAVAPSLRSTELDCGERAPSATSLNADHGNTDMAPPLLQTQLKPETPELNPMQSPNLPLPSPFPQEHLDAPAAPSLEESPSKQSFQPPPPLSNRVSDSMFGFGFGISRTASRGHDNDSQTRSSNLALQPQEQQAQITNVRDEDMNQNLVLTKQSQVATSSDTPLSAEVRQDDSSMVQPEDVVSDHPPEPPEIPTISLMDSMTHVSDSQDPHENTSFGCSITPLPEGQGQPTGSFATSIGPDHSSSFASQVVQAPDTILELGTNFAPFPSPLEIDITKDAVDAILAQVPSYYAERGSGVAAERQVEEQREAEKPSTVSNLPSFADIAMDTSEESQRQQQQLLDSAEHFVLAENSHIVKPEVPAHAPERQTSLPGVDKLPDIAEEDQAQTSIGKSHEFPGDTTDHIATTQQPDASTSNIMEAMVSMPASAGPMYPDLTQQLRTIHETAVEDSQITNIESDDIVTTSEQGASISPSLAMDKQQSDHYAEVIKLGSSQNRAATRSSSAVDIMGFFGASTQASRATPRLSAQTTAIPSDLTVIERQLDELVQSDQTTPAKTENVRRASRRPGEVRKVLRMPEAQIPLADLQISSSQPVLTQSTATDTPRRVTRAASRRSQSVLTDVAENIETAKQPMDSSQSPITRRMSRSTIIESVETEGAAVSQMSDRTPLVSSNKSAFTVEAISPTMTQTQSDPFTQSKVENPLKTSQSGLRTSYSYYVPLANLSDYLNKALAYDSIIDVLAVVYRATSAASKAEKGRKDWFTKMRVTQPGFWRNTTLVQVFRGYKEAVPNAEAGDVILLRSFQVTGDKRGGVALKSIDGSAWCIFKADAKTHGKMQVANHGYDGNEAEVMTGPPAEFGDQERHAAEELKSWWKETKPAR